MTQSNRKPSDNRMTQAIRGKAAKALALKKAAERKRLDAERRLKFEQTIESEKAYICLATISSDGKLDVQQETIGFPYADMPTVVRHIKEFFGKCREEDAARGTADADGAISNKEGGGQNGQAENGQAESTQ